MNGRINLKCPKCKAIFEVDIGLPPYKLIKCPECEFHRVMRSLDKLGKRDIFDEVEHE